MTEVEKLIKADKEKKLIKGLKESLQALKQGKAAEVFVTSACPDTIKREVREMADLSKTKLVELDVTSEQLSAQLKKPFTITVAAISK